MLLAACTCSLERCLFKSIACFSVGQLNCQRPLLNILDSGHHLHFQKTPLPGCEVGVFTSARPRATAPGAVLPGLLLWRWCGHGASVQAVGATSAVSPCNLRAQGTLTQPGLLLPFAAGGGWGPPLPGALPALGWGCRLHGGGCPVWRKGRPSAPWGDLCVGPPGAPSLPVAVSLPGSVLSGQCSPPLSSRTRLLLGISKASQLRKLCPAFWASFQAGALTGFAAFPWSGRSRLLLLRAQPPLLCEAGQGLQGSFPGVCVPLDGPARHFIAHLTAHDPLCVPLSLDQDGACCGEQPSPAVVLAEGL